MLQSHIVELDGTPVGVAIRIDRGYRFAAIDPRLEDLEAPIWSSLEEVRRVARRVLAAAGMLRPVASPVHSANQLVVREGH